MGCGLANTSDRFLNRVLNPCLFAATLIPPGTATLAMAHQSLDLNWVISLPCQEVCESEIGCAGAVITSSINVIARIIERSEDRSTFSSGPTHYDSVV